MTPILLIAAAVLVSSLPDVSADHLDGESLGATSTSVIDGEECPVIAGCCEEDCCGPETRWSSPFCVYDLYSPGFTGNYNDSYTPGCVSRVCCDDSCCGPETTYEETIRCCVPLPRPCNCDIPEKKQIYSQTFNLDDGGTMLRDKTVTSKTDNGEYFQETNRITLIVSLDSSGCSCKNFLRDTCKGTKIINLSVRLWDYVAGNGGVDPATWVLTDGIEAGSKKVTKPNRPDGSTPTPDAEPTMKLPASVTIPQSGHPATAGGSSNFAATAEIECNPTDDGYHRRFFFLRNENDPNDNRVGEESVQELHSGEDPAFFVDVFVKLEKGERKCHRKGTIDAFVLMFYPGRDYNDGVETPAGETKPNGELPGSIKSHTNRNGVIETQQTRNLVKCIEEDGVKQDHPFPK